MRQLAVCDDVSVARSKGTLVSRRALVDTILGMTTCFILCRIVLTVFFQVSKIIGAVVKLGQAVTGAIASIACILDHYHVPGYSEYSVISPKTLEVGLGLYNEPVRNCCNCVR